MFHKTILIRLKKLGLVFFSIYFFIISNIYAQDIDELRLTFFKQTDTNKDLADTVNAKLYAPRTYESALNDYKSAEDTLKRGGSIEFVRRKASESSNHFIEATKISKSTQITLAQVMKSRENAANAKANKLAKNIWDKAQRAFGTAILALEKNNTKEATQNEADAVTFYRDAELIAIKAQYLSETRNLLDQANKIRVSRYAPKTLNKAKQLLLDAERELSENRYDTDIPRNLAKQANYEAKHSIYLADLILKVRRKELSIEDLILYYEKPLKNIADTADIVPQISNGYEILEIDVISHIENQRNEIHNLKQEVESNILRLADMQEEIRSLDNRLGGATAERAALIQRLETEEHIKAQFEKIEKMFKKNEARVFRERDQIILRLVGLTFASAKAEIKKTDFNVLAKVEKAIDVFPNSNLIIEGHTDSYGGDISNQKLSQERAEAIRQYMINAMRLPEYRLIATGFGETNPVANNETESGRARNRRIDIIIQPNIDLTQ